MASTWEMTIGRVHEQFPTGFRRSMTGTSSNFIILVKRPGRIKPLDTDGELRFDLIG